MKKIALLLLGIFVVLLVAVVSIPLFVNVDKYRPQITAEVNKNIQGKLELGKLTLNLWKSVNIKAESITVTANGFAGNAIEANNFQVEIPYTSIFSSAPKITAVIDAPKINVIKEKNGQMNLMQLFASPTATTDKTTESNAANMALAAPMQSPANLGAVANGAGLTAKNIQTQNNSMASDSLTITAAAPKVVASAKKEQPAAPTTSEQTTIAPAAPAQPTLADTKISEGKVPAIIAGATLGLRITNGNVSYADKVSNANYLVNGLDLDARNIGLGSPMTIKLKAPVKGSMPAVNFEGPVEMAANIQPILVGSAVKSAKGDIEIDATKLNIKMQNGSFQKGATTPLVMRAKFDGDEKELLVRSLDIALHEYKLHAKGRVTVEPMTAKIEINSDPLRLEKLQDLVPMVQAYQLKGMLSLNSSVEGELSNLKINGDLKWSDGAFFVKDVLVEPLKVQAQIGFSENMINIARIGLSATDSEIQLQGTIRNFLAPQYSLAVNGKSLNLDKVLVMEGQKAAWLPLISEAYAAPSSGLNPLLPYIGMPLVANGGGILNAQISKLTVKQSVIEQITVKTNLQKLLLKVTEASFKTFGGYVKGNAEVDLKSPTLAFKTNGGVEGISAKEAFATYFPKYKNTLEGNANASWNVTGTAYPEATRLKNLKGGAKILAKDGVLKSIDFQDNINNAMKKVPFLKDKNPVKLDEGFKTLTADLKFNNGTIQAEPIEVQPRNKGFVVKGKSSILESLEQESFFDLYDPQGILPKEFQAGGKPAIAFRMYGPLQSPKADYEYTLKKLASGAGKTAAKNLVEKFIEKSSEGEGKGKVQDLLKKGLKLFK